MSLGGGLAAVVDDDVLVGLVGDMSPEAGHEACPRDHVGEATYDQNNDQNRNHARGDGSTRRRLFDLRGGIGVGIRVSAAPLDRIGFLGHQKRLLVLNGDQLILLLQRYAGLERETGMQNWR